MTSLGGPRRAIVDGNHILYNGRRYRGVWIDQWKIGSDTQYRGETITIDLEFAERAVDSFDRATAQGFLSEVRRQHERDGYQYGVNAAMRIDDRGYVQTFTALIDSDLREKFNSGQAEAWSPAFADVTHPHPSGDSVESFPDLLVETSFVSGSHQWIQRGASTINPGVTLGYVGSVHLFGEQVMNEDTDSTVTEPEQDAQATGADAPVTEVPEWFAVYSSAQDARYEALASGLATVVASIAPAPAEMSDDEARIKLLEQQVADLSYDNSIKECAALGIVGSWAEALAKVRVVDEAAFAAAIADAPKQFAAPSPVTAVQSPKGSTGQADTGTKVLSAKEQITAAKEAGFVYGKGGFMRHILKTYGEQHVDEVRTLAARELEAN